MTTPDRDPGSTRCEWSNADPLYIDYHDREWGVPVHDDRSQFEFLVLEGAQAGLSWMTVLRKRPSYRRAFDDFDAEKVARYGERKIEALCNDPGIVRNRKKIESAVLNAQAFLAIQEKFGSFDAYIWHFVDGEPKQNAWRTVTELPANSPESEALSRDLKQRGFRFVGPTICYAHMQATGLVNDHIVDCFRYAELRAGR